MSGESRHPAADAVRDRIVETFSERARTLGPRSVVMAELARDMGMSTRTLYRHFRSKSDLMNEVVSRFAAQWEDYQDDNFSQRVPPEERMLRTALRWLEMRDQFSQAFWKEARQQYPDAWQIWQKTVRKMSVRAYQAILPDLREDAPPMLLIQLLYGSIWQAAIPERCDRLGISRQESVRIAVSVWCGGALKRPRLRLVKSEPGADESEPGADG